MSMETPREFWDRPDLGGRRWSFLGDVVRLRVRSHRPFDLHLSGRAGLFTGRVPGVAEAFPFGGTESLDRAPARRRDVGCSARAR